MVPRHGLTVDVAPAGADEKLCDGNFDLRRRSSFDTHTNAGDGQLPTSRVANGRASTNLLEHLLQTTLRSSRTSYIEWIVDRVRVAQRQTGGAGVPHHQLECGVRERERERSAGNIPVIEWYSCTWLSGRAANDAKKPVEAEPVAHDRLSALTPCAATAVCCEQVPHSVSDRAEGRSLETAARSDAHERATAEATRHPSDLLLRCAGCDQWVGSMSLEREVDGTLSCTCGVVLQECELREGGTWKGGDDGSPLRLELSTETVVQGRGGGTSAPRELVRAREVVNTHANKRPRVEKMEEEIERRLRAELGQ